MKHLKKTLAFLLIVLSSLALKAQQQFVPENIAGKGIELSLKGKFHGIIYALMPNKGSVDGINYVNQIVKAVHVANKRDSVGKLVFDTAQIMTAATTYKMVADTYFNLSEQKEGLTAQDNQDMKADLIKQLSKPEYMDLLQVLKAIDDSHKANREEVRSAGIQQILNINYYQ